MIIVEKLIEVVTYIFVEILFYGAVDLLVSISRRLADIFGSEENKDR